MLSNYYDILGLGKNATKSQINKAYKSAILKYHPDRNKGKEKECTAKTKEINQAYSVLNNDSEKKIYDNYLNSGYSSRVDYTTYKNSGGNFGHSSQNFGFDPFSGFQQGGKAFDNVSDLFREFFGSSSANNFGSSFFDSFTFSSSGNASKNNSNNNFVRIKVSVSLEEMMKSEILTINYNRYIECNGCVSNYVRCVKCNTRGCDVCHYTGSAREKTNCNQCQGIGKYLHKEQIKVKAPKKLSKTIIRGYGSYLISKRAYGHLEIEFQLKKNENYSINENGEIEIVIKILLSDFINSKNGMLFTINCYGQVVSVKMKPYSLKTIYIENEDNIFIINFKVINNLLDLKYNVSSQEVENSEIIKDFKLL
ncbi:Chaperone protein DnaJ [bacterium AB1]|nr:Chaperone protein DnaJ [bacterium AB1]